MLIKPSRKANTTPPLHLRGAPVVIPPTVSSAPRRSDLALRVSFGLTDCCSISHVNRNLALALYHAQGAEVCWTPDGITQISCPSYLGRTECMKSPPEQPHATVAWVAHMPNTYPDERGRFLIATSDHGVVFDKHVVAMLNAPGVTGLMAISPGCAEALAIAAPEQRTTMLPLGVDKAIYKPQGPAFGHMGDIEWLGSEPDSGAFMFLVAGYMQPRKGFAEACEAYCRAFGDRRDVCLVVKAVIDRHGRDGRQELATLAAKRGMPCIGYYEGVLSEYELAALYRQADCLVNTHHREGFGLPPLEAMACGTPTLVTNFHGPSQYAHEDNCYLLPPGVIEPERSVIPGQVHRIDWAYFDLDVLAGLMEKAAAGENRDKFVAAGIEEAQKWTWERTAQTVVDLVEEECGTVQRRAKKWHSPQVDFSVVVCCRNGADYLERMVAGLPLPARSELLVLDDASTAEEAKRIADVVATRPEARLIRSDVQLGIGGSRERLFEETRGEFICSLDADLLFENTKKTWLADFRAIWKKSGGRFGILAPLLLWPDGTVQSAGACADFTSNVFFRLREGKQPVGKVAKTPALLTAASGAVLFFHKSLLDHCQVDTEYFPCWFEDSDFCIQARLAGYAVRYSPEVQVTHDAQSWCGSKEGVQQQRWAAVRDRFMARWRDVLEEDERNQDGTGALALL